MNSRFAALCLRVALLVVVLAGTGGLVMAEEKVDVEVEQRLTKMFNDELEELSNLAKQKEYWKHEYLQLQKENLQRITRDKQLLENELKEENSDERARIEKARSSLDQYFIRASRLAHLAVRQYALYDKLELIEKKKLPVNTGGNASGEACKVTEKSLVIEEIRHVEQLRLQIRNVEDSMEFQEDMSNRIVSSVFSVGSKVSYVGSAVSYVGSAVSGAIFSK